MIKKTIHWVKQTLIKPWFLWMLFWVNLLGSIYGFYWYKHQLLVTDWYFLPFVPDSPTASMFFTLVLGLWLLHQRSPLLEAFAAITLFKYGIWAVIMIIWGGLLDQQPFLDALNWQHWMLIASHLGMALQAVLYFPFYTFRSREVWLVGGWTLLNDVLDYGFDIHPWVAPPLESYSLQLAIFTILLSGVSLFIFLILSIIPTKSRLSDFPLFFKKKAYPTGSNE